jgi:aryl-alcohol dehydrogenase-like predicted oxidoreductase
MESRPLGSSELRVSSFGLGVMTFGGQTDEVDARRQLDLAFDSGITLFDTAENYPTPLSAVTQGRSEEILGRWIRDRGVRDRVIVATKVAGPGNAAGELRYLRGEARRLDRTNIRQAIDDSLRRLDTHYIDLYQVHWPERPVTTHGRARYSYLPDAAGLTPIEESLAALAEAVTSGKVRQLGVCNESPWGVSTYLAGSKRQDRPRIVTIQNGYSLLDRDFELGLAEFAMREQLGLIAYSPLAGGTLTGKYGSAPEPIPGSRSSHSPAFLRRLSGARVRAIGAYVELARAHGLEAAHMALAFARQQPFTASVLMAASNVKQLQDNLGAVDLHLSQEIMKAINAVHDGHPNPR